METFLCVIHSIEINTTLKSYTIYEIDRNVSKVHPVSLPLNLETVPSV